MTQTTEKQAIKEQPLTVEQANVLSNLYSKGYEITYKYLLRLTKNTNNAEDLTRETVIKISKLLKNKTKLKNLKPILKLLKNLIEIMLKRCQK